MMPTNTPAARYICKACGAESLRGIGYADSSIGPLHAPRRGCPNLHAATFMREAFRLQSAIRRMSLGPERFAAEREASRLRILAGCAS